MQQLKKTRPVDGWVRGSGESDSSLKDELLRLRREIDSLNEELAAAKSRAAPEGIEALAQGVEETPLVVDLGPGENHRGVKGTVVFRVTWNDIIRATLPQTFGGGADAQDIAGALASLAHQQAIRVNDDAAEHAGWRSATVSRSVYGKVMNQMVALGLVTAKVEGSRETTWVSTPYGATVGARLAAVTSGSEDRF